MPCRFDPHWSYRGLECLRIENRHLSLDVLPALGAKIHRLVDKRRDRDVLWHSPRIAPHATALHANFDDHWAGGWDDVFPTGVSCPNRDGDVLPHMGELWTQQATWRAEDISPERVAISFSIETPITPARWTRRIVVDADSPTVRLDYRIENLDTREVEFNWGLHPAQAISAAHRFDVPARSGEVDDAAGAALGRTGERYRWPLLRGFDVRQARGPEAGDFALHYLTDLSDGWVAATDTGDARGFGLVFDPAVFPVVWLWLVYGGWRGYHHAILEPWTGYPSSLADARAAGRAQVLAGGAVLETSVTAVLYGGVTSVSKLAADGAVEPAHC